MLTLTIIKPVSSPFRLSQRKGLFVLQLNSTYFGLGKTLLLISQTIEVLRERHFCHFCSSNNGAEATNKKSQRRNGQRTRGAHGRRQRGHADFEAISEHKQIFSRQNKRFLVLSTSCAPHATTTRMNLERISNAILSLFFPPALTWHREGKE